MQAKLMAIPSEANSDDPLQALSDEALMERYAQGTDEAFEVLFYRHKTTVYSFIYRFLIHSAQADDIFQTVFMRVIKNRKRYKPKAKFSTWLFTIVRSVCIDTMRKNQRRNETRSIESEESPNVCYIACSNPTPFEFSAEREMNSAIESCIHSLPDEQREIILLREMTSMTFDEIGERLGCSGNTAKSRMHYALLALRRQLVEQGISA